MKTRIKEMRLIKNMTQQQLADLVHVSSRTIISIEKEQYNPSLMLAYRIAEVFDTTIEELCCLKENKEDIGVDKEFKLNKYNLETTVDMINLISEAMDEETLIYVDLSDLKEIFQSKGAVSYSVKEFELDKNHAELAKMLEEDFYKSEGELTLKKGLLLAECSEAAGDNTLIYLNEVINALKDITESNIDMVFSYNEKVKDQKTMKIAYLRN